MIRRVPGDRQHHCLFWHATGIQSAYRLSGDRSGRGVTSPTAFLTRWPSPTTTFS